MDASNGSTEVVPASHVIPDLDVLLHEQADVCKTVFEPRFVNVQLAQGDVLIFCRRLCHRGGANLSEKRRNALIIQAVYLWGIGQEMLDGSRILHINAFQQALSERFGITSLSESLKNTYGADLVKLLTTTDKSKDFNVTPASEELCRLEAAERFMLRLYPPYPKDVKKST